MEDFGNCLLLSIDEESPDSGGNEQGSNSEPIATSVIGDEEGARSHDHRHNNGATERAAATMPLAASTTMDIEEEVEEGENPDCRREANGKDGGDGLMRSATWTTKTTEGSQNPDPMHDSRATERATAAAEKQPGLLQFQKALRRKLTPKTWTSAETIEHWLSGRNRRTPCRILAALDPVRIREWIGPGQFISFIKNCDFVIWKQGERDIEWTD